MTPAERALHDVVAAFGRLHERVAVQLVPCGVCQGTGWIEAGFAVGAFNTGDARRCSQCFGTGRIECAAPAPGGRNHE